MSIACVGFIACLLTAAPMAATDAGGHPTVAPADVVAQTPPPDAPRPVSPTPPPPREDAQRPRPPAGVDRPAPVPSPAVRMEGTIYELVLDEKETLSLDAAKLAREFPALSAFDKEMRRLGAARVLYRLDQGVILDGRHEVRIVSDQPYLSASTTGASHRTSSSPSEVVMSFGRKDIGAKIQLDGHWRMDGEVPVLGLELVLELSGMTDSTVALPDVRLPAFRKLTQQYSGRVRFGEPIVLLTVDASKNDRSDLAIAYVTRLVFHPN